MVGIAVSTFFFTLVWQFAQFILLLESMAFFGTYSLGFIPKYKVRNAVLFPQYEIMVIVQSSQKYQFCHHPYEFFFFFFLLNQPMFFRKETRLFLNAGIYSQFFFSFFSLTNLNHLHEKGSRQ